MNLAFFIIVLLVTISAGEIDICVPSFPEISDQFGLSVFKAELLLGVNLLAHCVGSFFAGNLGDRYGKKRVITVGLLIFIFGSLLCFVAPSYWVLLSARMIQGLGVALPMVLGPLILMDYTPKSQHQKSMSMLNGFCTLALATAPTLGSYTTLYFGWRFNFALLTFLGAIAFAFFVTGIRSDSVTDQKVSLSIREYWPIFQSPVLVTYIVGLCLMIGLYYTFVAMAPMVYVKSFGVSLKDLGLYQGTLTLVFGVLSIFNDAIVRRIGKAVAFFGSMTLISLFLLSCTYVTLFNVQSPAVITAVFLVLSIGAVYPVNCVYVLALNHLPQAEGRTSAVITVSKWVFSVIGFQLASYLYAGNFVSTGLVSILMGCLGILLIGKMYWRYPAFKREVCSELPVNGSL